MTLYKNKYRVESARLKRWNYSSEGYYFVTICTKNRECLFGEIADGEMILSEYGRIIHNCWFDLLNHYNNIRLDEFVIMPNHMHGIIEIIGGGNNIVETGFKPVSTVDTTDTPTDTPLKKRHGLFEFVRALKTFSARRINELRNSPGISVWQPRFHDRIIRGGNELYRIREYIVNNPQNWEKDNNYIQEAICSHSPTNPKSSSTPPLTASSKKRRFYKMAKNRISNKKFDKDLT